MVPAGPAASIHRIATFQIECLGVALLKVGTMMVRGSA
jgi:hypothetical protein